MRRVLSGVLVCAIACGVGSCKKEDGIGGGDPLIQVSHVPKYQDYFGVLKGFVRGVEREAHYVAVYIEVGGWWTKPYWNEPKTALAGNGNWSCDVVTGGIDEQATGYAAFLLPNDYYPPGLGGGSLPSVLYDYALDSTFVVRNENGHSPLERPKQVVIVSLTQAGNLGPFADAEVDQTVELRWRYGKRDNVDSFKVYARDNYDDELAELATAGKDSDTVSFTHRGVGRRCYRVRATNSVGNSDLSKETEDTCVYFSEIPIAASYVPYGLCFSPFRGAQDPNAGDVLDTEQVHDHVKFIRQYAKWIRTYGTAGGLADAGKYAHQYELGIAMGAWIGPDLNANRGELDRLIAAAGRQGEVHYAVVGSEVLQRGDLTVDQLLAYLAEFKAAFPAGPLLTTADTYDVLMKHPEVIAACDVVFAHFYPYWAGVYYDDAVYWLDQRYEELKAVCGEKSIVVAETGWPSAGTPQGHAVPSVPNAAFYFKNFVSWAKAKKVQFFYFEALDEPWKAAYEPNDVGAHWGVLGEDLLLKKGGWEVYQGVTMADNWTRTIPCGQGSSPSITITKVPAYDSIANGWNLQGSTCGVWPKTHAVAVYIKTESGWWNKPYFDHPVSLLSNDGTFSVDVMTDYHDWTATQMAVFLIRHDYLPPTLEGADAIPKRIFNDALASVTIDRPAPSP